MANSSEDQNADPPAGARPVSFEQQTAVVASTQSTTGPGEDTDAISLTASLSPGQTIRGGAVVQFPVPFGDYELLAELGRGGMGVVYKARSRTLKRVVALKMMLAGTLASQADIERFRSEAAAAAQLSHPNIVGLYEFGECEGRQFFSLEFIDGVSLATRLQKEAIETREAAALIHRLALALAYAHEKGVIHRDLKPANILLDPTGRPCITDFGLAKRVEGESQLTATGQILGTPAYMPPEQAESRLADIGPASDVYSLGATLYCLLTGRPPFQAARVVETIRQVLERDPLPPKLLNPDVDADLQTICLKCLEKEPARRFASAQLLADELGRYLAGEPIRSRPIGVIARGWRWCKRRPLHAALGVAAMLLVVLSLVGLYMQVRLSAAQQLGNTHAFYAKTQRIRAQLQKPAPGSAAEIWKSLQSAAVLQTGNEGAAEMRSLGTQALSQLSVHRISLPNELQEVEIVNAVAITSDGRQFALGASKGTPNCQIYIYDAATRQPIRQLWFNTVAGSVGRLLGGELSRFQDGFRGASFSPDGRWLAASTRHGQLHLWDLRTESQTPARSWQAHEGEFQLEFAPDSQTIYSHFEPKREVKEWDPASGTIKREGPPSFERPVVSPDGQWIASSEDKLILRKRDTLTEVHHWPKHSTGRYAFSGDSRTLCNVKGDVFQILSVPQGHLVKTVFFAQVIDAYPHLSPDGNWLVTSCADECVRIWDVQAGKPVLVIPVPGTPFPITQLSRDGKQLVIAGQVGGVAYELTYPQVCLLSPPVAYPLGAFDIAPDGQTLALVEQVHYESQAEDATLWQWHVTGSPPLRQTRWTMLAQNTRYPAWAECGAAYHPQENKLGLSTAWGAGIWQAPEKAPDQGHAAPRQLDRPWETVQVLEETALVAATSVDVFELRADPLAADGRALRLAHGMAVEYRFTPEQLQQLRPGFAAYVVLRVEGKIAGDETVFTRSHHRGGKSAAIAKVPVELVPNDGYQYYTWQIESLSQADERETPLAVRISMPKKSPAEALWIDRVFVVQPAAAYDTANTDRKPRFLQRTNLTWSPDGQRLWGIVDESTVACWDAAGRELGHYHNAPQKALRGDDNLTALAVGKQWAAAAGPRGDLLILRAESAQLEKPVPGTRGDTESLALLPDGQALLAGTAEGFIRFFGLPSGVRMAEVSTHQGRLSSLAVSRDGKVIISGSQDRSIKFWMRQGLKLTPLLTVDDLPAGVRTLRWSADQSRLAVHLDQEKIVRVYDLHELRKRLKELSPNLDW